MARRSPSPSSSPTRTCVGCGVRAAKSDLLRLVAVGDQIVPDAAARLPGRGAYLHPVEGCWERAQRRRALPRALRQPGALPADELAQFLAAQLMAGRAG
jgi:uncharacterized protein